MGRVRHRQLGFYIVMGFLLAGIIYGCGTGGGGDFDLGDGDNPGGCGSVVGPQNVLPGSSVPSGDGKATLTNPVGNVFSINVALGVDCNKSNGQQIANAYLVAVDLRGEIFPANLTVSYSGVNLGTIDPASLQLGQFDALTGWVPEFNANHNLNTQQFSVDVQQGGRYAVFSPAQPGGGGDTLPPEPPSGLRLDPSDVDGDGRVILIWDASTGDNGGGSVAGYTVYENGVPITVVLATSPLSFTVTNPVPPYSYQVGAFDNADPANQSDRTLPLTVLNP